MDAALGGGLARGAVHEVFGASVMDGASAAGFAIALAVRASGNKPVVWVRQDFVGVELGEIYAPGIAELGLSPDRLILVRARDGPSVLRAGEEAARCPPLGALLIEPWGNPKMLDLTASRRLALAAARSNVPLFMVRAGGTPTASAAATRWSVRASPSVVLDADAPGHAAFEIELLRDRAGASRRNWIVEWNRDCRLFKDIETVPRRLVSVPAGRSSHADAKSRRAV
jgi:protein ImuA